VPVTVVTAQPSDLQLPSADVDHHREDRRKALLEAGVEVLEVADLAGLLHILGERGMSSLFVEGGANVATAFLHAGFADRVILSQGSVEIGSGGLESPLKPSDMPAEFRTVRAETYGPDHCFEYERSS
jgi:diaminohydroxyphosphoribosylaminopyrimidine deaminase/5-amino-6-(5-phosphoribosylamino)uracil reductase